MKLTWSAGAEEDLTEIMEYIAEDNIERAVSFTLEIESQAERLADYPSMGVCLDGYPDNYRILHYKSYSIVYEAGEDSIIIHEIFNQSRKYRRTTPL